MAGSKLFLKGQMALYGSIVGSPPRRVGGTARSALVVSAAASLAVVGVILVASSSMSASSNVLLDKQQAAWYDGTTVYEEDHNPALYARGYSAGRGRGVKPGRSAVMLNDMEEKEHSEIKVSGRKQLALKGDMPFCFKKNSVDTEKATARRRMEQAAQNLGMSYPSWAKGESVHGHGQDGEWRHDRGPPYVMRVTLFSGDGVDTKGSGTLVRRILGLKTSFGKPCDLRSCHHAWSNNNYLNTFDGPQFRFLYRNMCSVLVVPPLTNGAGPILSDEGQYRMHHFLNSGHNTMIVLGSVANILFLNQNYVDKEGGLSMEPEWVDGPYEAQANGGTPKAKGTPFEALSVTLPGPGTSVVGVKLSTLPANAISYYEAQDVSVVFEIPTDQGRILYLGYDYSEPVTPWVHALIAATNFPDFDPETAELAAAPQAAEATQLKAAVSHKEEKKQVGSGVAQKLEDEKEELSLEKAKVEEAERERKEAVREANEAKKEAKFARKEAASYKQKK